MRRAGAFVLIVVLALAACAPQVIPQGPNLVPPHLEADAFFAGDGRRLPVTVTAPKGAPRGAIVALHGFNDYARHFDDMAAFLAGQGVITYALDQRGFGRGDDPGLWGGTEAMVHDARALVGLVRARHANVPVILLGASMGGAIALAAAPDLNADGLVLAAPALWGWRTMNPFYRASLWTSAHVAPGWTLTGRGLGRKPSDNIAVLRRMGADPFVIKETRIDAIYGLVGAMDEGLAAAGKVRLPTLVLFGDDDQIVPESPVDEMVAAMTAPCRFVKVEKGYHMVLVDLGAARVWRLIADFAMRERPAKPGCTREVLAR